MREYQYSNALLESILTGSIRSLSDEPEIAPSEQEDIVPRWLVERLRTLYSNIENEPLPEAFVILFRQMNAAEHT